MRRGFSFLTCPSCKLRGVYVRTTSEDWWYCRYCQWSTCATHEDATDRYGRMTLARCNPSFDLWVSDLFPWSVAGSVDPNV